MNCKVEFYNCPDGSINIQEDGKPVKQFDMSCKEIIEELNIMIRDIYPEAYKALSELYARGRRNKQLYEYRIVHRFIRCNFGEYDGLQSDIDGVNSLNFEFVDCPLRGECKHEGVICRPKKRTRLSEREREVAELLAKGYEREDIAEELGMTPRKYSLPTWAKDIKSDYIIYSKREIN